jgi:hypothetical protein
VCVCVCGAARTEQIVEVIRTNITRCYTYHTTRYSGSLLLRVRLSVNGAEGGGREKNAMHAARLPKA